MLSGRLMICDKLERGFERFQFWLMKMAIALGW